MKVALVGFEVEGRAAYAYWAKLGAEITVCDQDPNKKVPEGAERQLGDDYLKNLDRFDVVWRTAGLNPDKIIAENPGIEDKITTTINEFLRVCPTKNVIGLTGTKGKGTTSTLITEMLRAAGKDVHLGGNIGVSPFDFLPKLTAESWVVLELSSYQLADLRTAPHTAVCLMMQADHLTWHGSMEKYVDAKRRLFVCQKSDDYAIYFAQNEMSRDVASSGPAIKVPYYAEPGAIVQDGEIRIGDQTICRTDEIKLPGKHNWQNACAAITALWQTIQTPDAMCEVLRTFPGLPHRIELVRELDGVRYYNDSYASAPLATQVALEAVPGPKIMILGGFERNVPLDELVAAIADHADDIRTLLIWGASGNRLADELRAGDFTNFKLSDAKTMPDMVAEARTATQPGDAVVLSPGFASFDMFKNFEDRGKQFRAAVEAL